VGLDGARFEGCMAEGVHRSAVQRDFDDGVGLGVTGTPTVFVNGRPLSGAQPLEVFVRIVEEELRSAVAARAETKK
jgi:protein-disulfide isomerase